ncbi:MAG TPA: Amuc_1102 family pilus-like protein [Chthoniobacterales bacterium]
MTVSPKISLSLLIISFLAIFLQDAEAQRRPKDYEIRKVTVSFLDTPDYQYTGDQRRSEIIGKWMEIETMFEALPEFTEELTFRYYVQINKLLFVGEVTHVNIPKGRSLYSVMYISPRSMARIMDGATVTPSSMERVSVEISKQGQLLAFGPWRNEKAGWWSTMPQKTGFLLNKSETPFAPLYWDRYEAIRSSARN